MESCFPRMTDSDDEACSVELLVVGLLEKDHASGFNLQFNKRSTRRLLVVSAETGIEGGGGIIYEHVPASVYVCMPFIVGLDQCVSELVQERESECVCVCVLEEAEGGETKNH